MLVVAVLLHEVVVLVMPVKAAERGVRMNKIVANFMAGIVMNMNRNSWFDLTYHGGIAYPWKIPVEHDVRKIASAGSEHITTQSSSPTTVCTVHTYSRPARLCFIFGIVPTR